MIGLIELDGSHGEGGGQILRTAIALSAVLGKEVRIVKIRAGRPNPGLQAQHLTGVKAAATLCNAEVKGGAIGSEQLEFRPAKIRAGRFHFDVGTAGSVTLVLQTIMPILAFAPDRIELELTGGTDVKWSPPVDFMNLVELPVLEKCGYKGDLLLVRRGHYPKGRGYVTFTSQPIHRLKPIVRTDPRGPVIRTMGVSHASGLPSHVAVRQAESATKVLTNSGLPAPDIRVVGPDDRPFDIGSGIVVAAVRGDDSLLGADCLGERGISAERVGSEAATRLVEDLKTDCSLDRHMSDMIIPYAVLAEGLSQASLSKLTGHVLTNVWVAEQLTGVKFNLDGEPDRPGSFRVQGLGVTL